MKLKMYREMLPTRNIGRQCVMPFEYSSITWQNIEISDKYKWENEKKKKWIESEINKNCDQTTYFEYGHMHAKQDTVNHEIM